MYWSTITPSNAEFHDPRRRSRSPLRALSHYQVPRPDPRDSASHSQNRIEPDPIGRHQVQPALVPQSELRAFRRELTELAHHCTRLLSGTSIGEMEIDLGRNDVSERPDGQMTELDLIDLLYKWKTVVARHQREVDELLDGSIERRRHARDPHRRDDDDGNLVDTDH